MTNYQHNVEVALRKFPKAKRIAVENATVGVTKWDMGVAMNVSADTACYKWNAHTVNAIKYVINHYAEETMGGAIKCGNRGFILPNVETAAKTDAKCCCDNCGDCSCQDEQQRRDEKNTLDLLKTFGKLLL